MNEGAECQTISPAAKEWSYVLIGTYFDIENFVLIIFKYVFIQDGRQLLVHLLNSLKVWAWLIV